MANGKYPPKKTRLIREYTDYVKHIINEMRELADKYNYLLLFAGKYSGMKILKTA
ncbi:hypothetical protein [Xenorhabdus bovienii]|uniref:Uncharacterized protein n=1 Tax=Xenorhabdus bovienii str. feltiae Moldova TaxID=1398200 RepID=A0A077NQ61_XENBV|nr:hypothetical protein [Xenorhabdus bovienii]CDH00548.1 hypothetical protein XBFM1_1710016 [Xenorhabdus bovienii str. feltiae Moldova]